MAYIFTPQYIYIHSDCNMTSLLLYATTSFPVKHTNYKIIQLQANTNKYINEDFIYILWPLFSCPSPLKLDRLHIFLYTQ